MKPVSIPEGLVKRTFPSLIRSKRRNKKIKICSKLPQSANPLHHPLLLPEKKKGQHLPRKNQKEKTPSTRQFPMTNNNVKALQKTRKKRKRNSYPKK